MTITLNLPQDLEHELAAEAERLGLSLSEYALRVLSASRFVEPMPTTGSELVAYWQREGLIGSRPDIPDSQEHARKIRAAAERRYRAP
jgi:hypothetical protein